jgi:hypothetical protein
VIVDVSQLCALCDSLNLALLSRSVVGQGAFRIQQSKIPFKSLLQETLEFETPLNVVAVIKQLPTLLRDHLYTTLVERGDGSPQNVLNAADSLANCPRRGAWSDSPEVPGFPEVLGLRWVGQPPAEGPVLENLFYFLLKFAIRSLPHDGVRGLHLARLVQAGSGQSVYHCANPLQQPLADKADRATTVELFVDFLCIGVMIFESPKPPRGVVQPPRLDKQFLGGESLLVTAIGKSDSREQRLLPQT